VANYTPQVTTNQPHHTEQAQQVNRLMAKGNPTTELQGSYGITQCYLPPDRRALTPANKAGT